MEDTPYMERTVKEKWLFVRPVSMTASVETRYDITDVETI